MKITVKSARAGFAEANLAAARIIAADPAKYPEGSLMATWALAVLSRQETPTEQEKAA